MERSIVASDVTVVIPCTRSFEPWLGEAVRSVQGQSAGVPQLIVVGYDLQFEYSPQQLDVVAPFALHEAFNLGLDAVTTPYVVCLDADNMLDLSYLSRTLPHAGRHRIVSPGFAMMDDQTAWVPTAPFALATLLRHNIVLNASLFDVAIARRIGGFQPFVYLDWDFWIRAVRSGAEVVHVPEVLQYVRRHPASTTARIGPAAHAAAKRAIAEAHGVPEAR